MFSEDIQKEGCESQLLELQMELIENPSKGDLIKGSGGLRKVRMAGKQKGKSGGYRVIYYVVTSDSIIFVYLYAKNKQITLTPNEVKILKSIIQPE